MKFTCDHCGKELKRGDLRCKTLRVLPAEVLILCRGCFCAEKGK
jgi:hypothetical protein